MISKSARVWGVFCLAAIFEMLSLKNLESFAAGGAILQTDENAVFPFWPKLVRGVNQIIHAVTDEKVRHGNKTLQVFILIYLVVQPFGNFTFRTQYKNTRSRVYRHLRHTFIQVKIKGVLPVKKLINQVFYLSAFRNAG